MSIIQWSTINQLHIWTQTVLPATFDDSLSYYEVLAKLTAKLNEVIQIVNAQGEGIETYIIQLFDQYKAVWDQEVDAKIAASAQTLDTKIDTIQSNLQGQISSLQAYTQQSFANLQADLESYKTSNDQRITELQSSFSTQLSQFQAQVLADISAFEASVNTKLATYDQKILDTDNANRAWTLSLLEDFKQSLPKEYPPIIDPSDGKLEDVQTVINHIWDFLNTNALTAEEYDGLDLTAQEYDDKLLTAKQYDQTGKLLLMPDSIKGDDT